MESSTTTGAILGNALADVAVARENTRRRRLRRLSILLGLGAAWFWIRVLAGEPLVAFPSLGADAMLWMPGLLLVVALVFILGGPVLLAGKSPHVLYRSSEIAIGMEDVRGAGVVKEEVNRTLELFLAYKTFRDGMGGTPRRAILFEGPPGTPASRAMALAM